MSNIPNIKLVSHTKSYLSIFYRIRLKDYFEVLQMHLNDKYKTLYDELSKYSDATEECCPITRAGKADVNPDVTLGQMLLIAGKMFYFAENYDEYLDICKKNESKPLTAEALEAKAFDIISGIMIKPFDELLATPDGKTIFKKITSAKRRKDGHK